MSAVADTEKVLGMHEMLKEDCISPTHAMRVLRSHTPPEGKALPEPCDCCDFGHNPETIEAEYNELLRQEAELAKDDSKAGKQKFSKWRMAHASLHGNVQPGMYGP